MGDEQSLNDCTETGRTEWEFRTAERFGGMTDAEIVGQLQFVCIDELNNGHALTKSEIRTLRGLLRIKPDVSDDVMARNTDFFCIVVGLHARVHVNKPIALRRKDFDADIVAPLSKVKEMLQREEYRKEFLQFDGTLCGDDLARLVAVLEGFCFKAEGQLRWLDRLSTKAKDDLSDLKLFHVTTAEMLWKYLVPNSRPMPSDFRSDGWFINYVRLLARPIFKQQSKRDGFPGAIAKFARGWKNEPEI